MTEPQFNIPLKPCPFCGMDNAIVSHAPREGLPWLVLCPDCGARSSNDLGESGAIEQWNTRPIEDALLEACEAILAWCGTGDGKYFLPLTPPWKAGLLAAVARAKGES